MHLFCDAWIERYEREGNFSAVFVWNADDTGVGNRGMVQEMTLEFGWSDLKASYFDQFL